MMYTQNVDDKLYNFYIDSHNDELVINKSSYDNVEPWIIETLEYLNILDIFNLKFVNKSFCSQISKEIINDKMIMTIKSYLLHLDVFRSDKFIEFINKYKMVIAVPKLPLFILGVACNLYVELYTRVDLNSIINELRESIDFPIRDVRLGKDHCISCNYGKAYINNCSNKDFVRYVYRTSIRNTINLVRFKNGKLKVLVNINCLFRSKEF